VDFIPAMPRFGLKSLTGRLRSAVRS